MHRVIDISAFVLALVGVLLWTSFAKAQATPDLSNVTYTATAIVSVQGSPPANIVRSPLGWNGPDFKVIDTTAGTEWHYPVTTLANCNAIAAGSLGPSQQGSFEAWVAALSEVPNPARAFTTRCEDGWTP